MAVMSLDVLREFAILGTVEIDGKKVSRVIGIDWEALAASEHSIAISSFKFDRETGMMTEFVRDDALQATGQYRDMYGLRAPRRKEVSGPGGKPIQTEDVTQYTDEELAQLEAIQAARAARAAIADRNPGGERAPGA